MNRNLEILYENGILVPRSKRKIFRRMRREEILQLIAEAEALRIRQEITPSETKK
jgi:hypothetical protein